MDKWIKKIFSSYKETYFSSYNLENNIQAEDMTNFIDGHMDVKDRDRVIFHLNRCQNAVNCLKNRLKISIFWQMQMVKKMLNMAS